MSLFYDPGRTLSRSAVRCVYVARLAPRWGVLALLLLAAAAGGATAQVPVPEQGAYHAAFSAPSAGGIEQFVDRAGKSLAIEMDYKDWGVVESFPENHYDEVHARGNVPHITWEPWDWDGDDAPYSNQRIIDGAHDDHIRSWAQAIKEWGHPLMIRWGHEMNGDWYPWSGAQSGGATRDKFGDPDKADGPERYVAAYRHVHDIFEEVGADNVAWVWAPNVDTVPNASWNRAANYYPGDAYVDWIGMDGYNAGNTQSWSSWRSFASTFRGFYNQFEDYGKPMMVAEFASAEGGGDKGQWIEDAYTRLETDFPQIKAMTWFNENKESDWRINSSEQALQGYKTAVSDPYILGQVAATSIGETPQEARQQTRLLSASPNPFAERVQIPVEIARSGSYTLGVWNVLGQRVSELHAGFWRTGRHVLGWDPEAARHPLPAGVYVVRLTGRGVEASRVISYLP